MPDDPAKAVADDFWEFMMTIVEGQQRVIVQTSAALTALVHVVLETHPELIGPYEQYVQAHETTSPLAQSSARLIEQLAHMRARYRQLHPPDSSAS